MIEIDSIKYRNLQEQVEYLTQHLVDLEEGTKILNEFGIKVIDQIDNILELPTADNYLKQQLEMGRDIEDIYGDAIAVGTEQPYTFYIFTRAFSGKETPEWFDIGKFPLAGPQGIQGEKGEKGDKGDSPYIKNGEWYVGDKSTGYTALKNLIDAEGQYSVKSLGTTPNDVSAYQSFAIGAGNTVNADNSFVIGQNNNSLKYKTPDNYGNSQFIAGGNNNKAYGSLVSILGHQLRANVDSTNNYWKPKFVCGCFNKDVKEALMIVGRGDNEDNRDNSMVVYTDGHGEISKQGTTDTSIVQKQYVDNKFSSSNFKTLFGNQNIVGSGNIDIYRHNIQITGDNIKVYLTYYSSKNLIVNSLTDLKTLIGDEFEESCTGVVNNELAYLLTQSKIISLNNETLLTNVQFIDNITTT